MAYEVRKDDDEILSDHIRRLDVMLHIVRCSDGKNRLIGRRFWLLLILIRFVNVVVYDVEEAFSIGEGHCGKLAKPASKLASFFDQLCGIRELYARDLSYAPHVKLFFDCYRKHPIRHCVMNGPNRRFEGDRTEGEVFNDFVALMRKEGDWIDVKRKVGDWERNATENMKRLDSCVSALFEKYGRLRVLGIDLLNKAAVLDGPDIVEANGRLHQLANQDQLRYMEGECDEDETRDFKAIAHVDVADVMTDRDRLFANMRRKPSLFEHMVGVVWSIGSSRASGFHLHCVLLFSILEKRDLEWLNDQIGQYWVNNITRGRGHYHNFNRAECEGYGVGEVVRHDGVKRGNLMRSLEFLAMKDRYVHVKTSVGCKRFGMVGMLSPKPTAGSPRRG